MVANSNTVPLELSMSIEMAMKHHRAGNLVAAERIYRSVLARDKDHIDANYLLGLVELDQEHFSIAVPLITRSRDLAPMNPLYHYNLGRALQGMKQWDEAERSYRKAIKIKHDHTEARYCLGMLLQEVGRNDDAITEYRELLQINPSLAAVHNNLGNVFHATGRLEEGINCLRKAIELEPEFAAAWGNLGSMLQTAGRYEESTSSYEKALALEPDGVNNLFNFGNLKRITFDYQGAIEMFSKAAKLDPSFTGAFNNLANVYKLLGKLKLGVTTLEAAIEKVPEDAALWNNLANIQVSAGEISIAIENYRRAIELRPEYVDAYTNLVYALNYPAGISEQEVFEEHLEWSRRFEVPVEIKPLPAHSPAEGRKLCIGYVSGDFRRHSVAYFFEPLLEAHDRADFEVYCYDNNRSCDDVTNRIMGSCDHWRPIADLSDDQAAEMIRQDSIDVLIDLSGHTEGNRLLVFARRPAPVQVTWLGYPNTTGMCRMDYRLVDEVTDPSIEADKPASEVLYRMPYGFLCYRGYEQAPDVQPPPSIKKGYITFGSFNNLTKVTHEVVTFWAEILHAVPDSRLLMKTNQLEDAETCERYRRWFGELGISGDRIDLRGRTPGLAEHLAIYGEVDIALDTFPYNGTTTTCEALWMGVPVLALNGDTHRSRVGESILIHAGLPDLVAGDRADFVSKIQSMIADPDTLCTQRAEMRQRLSGSQLCDLSGFARSIETAYRHFYDAALTRAS